MTTPSMRDALIGRLYASLQGQEVTVGVVTGAVDAALETTGYVGLAALATSAVAVQALVADQITSPSPELAAAMATLETEREAVSAHYINGDLVALP